MKLCCRGSFDGRGRFVLEVYKRGERGEPVLCRTRFCDISYFYTRSGAKQASVHMHLWKLVHRTERKFPDGECPVQGRALYTIVSRLYAGRLGDRRRRV